MITSYLPTEVTPAQQVGCLLQVILTLFVMRRQRYAEQKDSADIPTGFLNNYRYLGASISRQRIGHASSTLEHQRQHHSPFLPYRHPNSPNSHSFIR